MNFEKCFEILNDRQSQSSTHSHTHSHTNSSTTSTACPCLTALTTEHVPLSTHSATDGGVRERGSEVEYEKLESLELIEKFMRLQEERVAVFKEFDASLHSIVQDGRIAEYSLLCAEITARFQIISKIIIIVQNILLTRPGVSAVVGACIKRLQKHEGEKLMVVAAQHMDIIREHYPAFAPHMGACTNGSDSDSGGGSSAVMVAEGNATNSAYNSKKKMECEEFIRVEMENIMSEKCDLM